MDGRMEERESQTDFTEFSLPKAPRRSRVDTEWVRIRTKIVPTPEEAPPF